MSRPLVLASASPARLQVLRAGGFAPIVQVSGVDENVDDPLVLSHAKAVAVATDHRDTVVIGCDSMLRFAGALVGKPGTPLAARTRWQAMRGHDAELETGHTVIDTASGRVAQRLVSTTVRFADVTDAEIDAYIATGEPLGVAGAFTIDGRGALFITEIHGDPTNVIGISLPTVRDLFTELGLSAVEFWAPDGVEP